MPQRAARPHGSDPSPRLHRAGETRDRARFLVPERARANGLTATTSRSTTTPCARSSSATPREAGVRNLEREIASICRKIARKVVAEGRIKIVTSGYGHRSYLACLGFRARPSRRRERRSRRRHRPGVDRGRRRDPVDRSHAHARQGRLTLTGQLGDVMQESAQAAMSYVRSKAQRLDIDPRRLRPNSRHPRALARRRRSRRMARRPASRWRRALVSALTERPVRHDVAMTGEITLRGKVLPSAASRRRCWPRTARGIKTSSSRRTTKRPGRHSGKRAGHARPVSCRQHGRSVEGRACRPAG